jgi:lipoprotein NlpD
LTLTPTRFIGSVLLLTLLLAGCGGDTYAPVVEHTPQPYKPAFRTVRAGDTLYSIAWEADLDYRDLARWNGIRSPYVIVPGQRLRLSAAPRTAAPAPRPTPSPRAIPAPPPSSTGRPVPVPAPAVPPEPKWQAVKSWLWPADGKVIRRFSARQGSKGIDIAGGAGRPVRAAAAGKVVYRGSGLRGYGQLIIIKHNETFLSAYAHNEKIFSKEGDWVAKGQRIATMGSTGTDRVKLHFEIRRHGTPVDPLKYLPRRPL